MLTKNEFIDLLQIVGVAHRARDEKSTDRGIRGELAVDLKEAVDRAKEALEREYNDNW